MCVYTLGLQKAKHFATRVPWSSVDLHLLEADTRKKFIRMTSKNIVYQNPKILKILFGQMIEFQTKRKKKAVCQVTKRQDEILF